VTKRVVKVEQFSDDYHDFDMNELMNNKELMEQLLMMEQEEDKKQQDTLISKSYLPSTKELELIKTNLNDMDDIEIIEQSSIINYAQKFKIDKFEFGIQFMIFPKSFINIWLGFIGIISNQTRSIQPFGGGGIGGIQMGGPSQTTLITEHYMSNLMISIPHRKPLNDEFGQTNMSSITLIADSDQSMDDAKDNNGMGMDNGFMISVNDLSMKLSKMLTKISKSTVQISCDIPSKILNAPIQPPRMSRMRMDDDYRKNDMNETNMLFQIEKNVMNIYNEIKSQNSQK